MTTLVLLHGRGQHTPRDFPVDRVPAFAADIRGRWLQALNTGLAAAGLDRVPAEAPVVFPFYGNAFRDAVDARESDGPGPDLALWTTGHPMPDDVQAVCEVKADLLDDVVTHLPPRRPFADGEPTARGVPAGVGRPWWTLDELLRVPWLRDVLQHLARQAGVSARVIESQFTDVAYYLGCAEVREMVLDLVEEALAGVPRREPLVIIAHSLGSVVAYDLLTRREPDRPVSLLVTTGSPLGLPAVQKHLLGHGGVSPAPVPASVPAAAGSWHNGYDVRDVVAILNPLAPYLAEAVPGQVRDLRIDTGQEPHAVVGYLENPEMARAVGEHLITTNAS
ncbi:hypothetical protein ABDK96_01390 [Citricoccus nitrophenolicus]|uniref:Uncharacterized protein n=1 Tax=Citricoccus nitrophenolicus TaxID=863575 RepID=A0ABV0IDW8_9MICC